MRYILLLLITLLSSSLISILSNKLIIYLQTKNHRGQRINEYLSSNHQKKMNTPTMGGIAIVISILLSSLMNLDYYSSFKYLCSIIVIVLFFIVGLCDDLLKYFRSYKGLNASIRFLVELLIGIGVFYLLQREYVPDEKFYLSTLISIDFGALIIIFFSLLIVGSANAMNLTDGLDGLAGGLTLIMLLPFIVLSIIHKEEAILFLLISIYGAVLGFIPFNISPAKLFMGDSGSLPLGAVFGFIAYILKCEFLLAIIGGLLVIETLSVILQVTSFKLFKKRIFLMTPFHHHLELKGKEENSIVIIYYIIGVTLSIISICLELFIG